MCTFLRQSKVVLKQCSWVICALMKLIICHVGHGAGITNEHMTLDLKMTRLETICKEPERKDRETKNPRTTQQDLKVHRVWKSYQNVSLECSHPWDFLCVIFKQCESAVQNIQQESLFNENVKTSLSLLRPLVHNWIVEHNCFFEKFLKLKNKLSV